jgi:hypothetical protein
MIYSELEVAIPYTGDERIPFTARNHQDGTIRPLGVAQRNFLTQLGNLDAAVRIAALALTPYQFRLKSTQTRSFHRVLIFTPRGNIAGTASRPAVYVDPARKILQANGQNPSTSRYGYGCRESRDGISLEESTVGRHALEKGSLCTHDRALH